MTTSSKWLRRALLGGAAFCVAATGAQADELSALKAQLEGLQNRVNQLESTPATNTPSGVPQSDGLITFYRGSDIGWDQSTHARPQEYIPEDRGFTIAITPSADLPAPVHEVTVSGYVKGDFIYDTHQDLGDSFSAPAITGGGDREATRLHARQSRFRIKSKSDTAVGQVRTLIEGDFEGGGGNQIVSNSTSFRLRHAWGEWDISPNTTIGVGQTWTNYMNLFAYADTVDFFGPVGMAFVRQGQVRLTYTSGPILFAIAVENPETSITAIGTTLGGAFSNTTNVACAESLGAASNVCNAAENVPDFTARLQYDAPGGHKFQVSGVVRNLRVDGDSIGGGISTTNLTNATDNEIGYGVLAAAAINLADIATLTATFNYGDGLGRYLLSGNPDGNLLGTAGAPAIRSIEAWSASVAIALGITDTTTMNVAVGYYDANRNDLFPTQVDESATVHVNLIWQPVSRFRMGVEGIYGRTDLAGRAPTDALRFQFGAWFFF
jgi:hypothetical protein